MLLIEHRERMVRHRGAACRHERHADRQSNQMPSHADPPFNGNLVGHLRWPRNLISP
jgi:hypothetical protein